MLVFSLGGNGSRGHNCRLNSVPSPTASGPILPKRTRVSSHLAQQPGLTSGFDIALRTLTDLSASGGNGRGADVLGENSDQLRRYHSSTSALTTTRSNSVGQIKSELFRLMCCRYPLLLHLDHGSAARLRFQLLRARNGQFSQRDDVRDFSQVPRPQVRGDALPDDAAQGIGLLALIPSRRTPRRMKGMTVVCSSAPPALPTQAMLP